MNNLTLYLAPVLIWGSTWLAITFQLGQVPPEVSVAYRFTLAGLILLGWSRLRGLRLRFSAADHAWMAAQGVLLFGLNYVGVYVAETRINSGLVAVIFSLIVFFNIAGTRFFFGRPIKPATLIAAIFGVTGVALIFLPAMRRSSASGDIVAGVTIAVLSTISASLGNLISARNQKAGMPVVQANAYGMLYGAALVALYALVIARHFTFDPSAKYMGSLLYLAVFGSVLAFGAYLTLVGRIGADRAGYTSAVIPIVALLLSVIFEGLRLHALEFTGIVLCLIGNVLVLRGRVRLGSATALPTAVPTPTTSRPSA